MIRKNHSCFFLLGILFSLFTMQNALADAFIVKQIKITGLQGVQESTVLSYIPIHVGQPVTQTDTVNILKVLYKTDFFSDVRLYRQGNTLVVHVVERPSIGLIQIDGNEEFTDKQMLPVLKDLGVAEGLPYDNSKVNSIVQGLKEQYHETGFYAVQVTAQAKPEPRNRVALYIKIKEGPIAKIRHIKIEGNQAFKEKVLLKTLKSKPSAWWRLSFLNHDDRYSKVQVMKDLDALRNFYLNRGYLRFQVVDQKVTVSPDNKSVDILIRISEGPVYKVSGFDIQGLSSPAYEEDKKTIEKKYIFLKPGTTFSRQNMINSGEAVRLYFAGKGHAFPVINPDPAIDDQNHTVFVTFAINPGPISYVRNIEFSGNDRTLDSTLRNRVSQMEASPYSIVEVEQSKARLSYLPYLSDVSVDTTPVSGVPDFVDLNYHLKEVNAGKASIQGGYSTSDGFIYGASLAEPNLLGMGRYASLNFNASQFQKSYSLNYVNPYFTTYGISRGVTIFSTITTPSSDQNLASYTMDGYGGAVNYGIPLSLNNRVNLGYGYTYIVLNNVDSSMTSPNIIDFVDEHPSPYNQFKGMANWTYSTLDRAVAPTRGFSQSLGMELGVPVLNDSLSYYKFNEEMKYYYPLGWGFILDPQASVGFGDGYGDVNTLPFFNNFYMGGIESLPGYAANSLGPQNPYGGALGGNLKLLGSLNLIVPNFTRKVRTALFVDAGNIFQTNKVDADQILYEDVTLQNMRMSAGLMVIWYSPMGPLQFSAAEAINAQSTDRKEWFGFSFGTSI